MPESRRSHKREINFGKYWSLFTSILFEGRGQIKHLFPVATFDFGDLGQAQLTEDVCFVKPTYDAHMHVWTRGVRRWQVAGLLSEPLHNISCCTVNEMTTKRRLANTRRDKILQHDKETTPKWRQAKTERLDTTTNRHKSTTNDAVMSQRDKIVLSPPVWVSYVLSSYVGDVGGLLCLWQGARCLNRRRIFGVPKGFCLILFHIRIFKSCLIGINLLNWNILTHFPEGAPPPFKSF